ncbi:hypothetical protein I302_104438 [Kwoniella bestiolae CBS 10118]|uniref:Uncharacterized protein n=1 Tax=Kwoniella bestiolae CBS 10118 TaxID=1296100 RepID=A0A1B9GB93_9TREE|nr:hypothetical protein I302_03143 [Kwoniella bestiolae CBS 10118]OCF28287.1 hypothetical protein I302_03143 [Kwoniella bestiolae CBS 10118]
MALRDANCYTLTLSQSNTDPSIIQLSESFGQLANKVEPRYARVREKRDDEAYSSAIYDVLTGARLASAGYEMEKSKKRRLQLHGPDEDVPFEFTGRINFEWTFTFEENKYRWTREVYGKDYICSLDRKPDPKVEICLARDVSSKGPARLQILHYNIDRFPNEIKDLRGLETLLVASLLCLLDAANDRNTLSRSPSSGNKSVKDGNMLPIRDKDVPPVPARPERVISEDDFEPENPNEIVVTMTSSIDNHIARAIALFQDPHVLFVVIRTKTAEAAQRALEVSLGVKRFRHHEGLAELYQYVIEEEVVSKPPPSLNGGKPGPKVIKLDDEPPKPISPSNPVPGKSKVWTPFPNIAIYLSTIELPDLKPGRREHLKYVASTSSKTSQHPPSAVSSAPPPVLPPKEPVPVHADSSKRTSSFGRLFRSHS